MILFPAIDLLNNRAVRLLYGDYNKVTDYGEPSVMAKKWASEGAEWLHVVDLDGARVGIGENNDAVKAIVDVTKKQKINVQLGGGIRSLDDIENRLTKTGVTRVILGTAACQNIGLVKEAIKKFGQNKVVLGVDVKNGLVAIKGWLETSCQTAIDLGKKMFDIGIKYAVITDISRDGALTGANVDMTVDFANTTKINVIASGGVASLDDVKILNSKNLYGTILGRAIYENKFSVKEALSVVN